MSQDTAYTQLSIKQSADLCMVSTAASQVVAEADKASISSRYIGIQDSALYSHSRPSQPLMHTLLSLRGLAVLKNTRSEVIKKELSYQYQ